MKLLAQIHDNERWQKKLDAQSRHVIDGGIVDQT